MPSAHSPNDPISNKLGELPCILDFEETNGCVHQRRIACSAGSTQLSLDMEVAFRTKRGWRGRATVELGGDSTCKGTWTKPLRGRSSVGLTVSG